MSSLNQVTLIGRVGKDPETKTFGNGNKSVSFSLATSENWTDKASNERKEKTQWHRIVIFNEALAGVAERFVKKGTQISIVGSVEYRKYTDTAGVEKDITEIVINRYNGNLVLLGGRDSGSSDAPRSAPASQPKPHVAGDDDIPF